MNIMLMISSFKNFNMNYSGSYYVEFKFYVQTQTAKYYAQSVDKQIVKDKAKYRERGKFISFYSTLVIDCEF